jgi:hypothetical protein
VALVTKRREVMITKGDFMKADNIIDGKLVPVQHGEVWLQPVTKATGQIERHNAFIVGHSETGHHHILEAPKGMDFEVITDEDSSEIFVKLFGETPLVHKKSFEIHDTKIIAPGTYAVFHKTEYDPWQQMRREVYD